METLRPSTYIDKSTSKFCEWLGMNSLTDSKLSQEVIEVLGYLAYEIVREVSQCLVFEGLLH